MIILVRCRFNIRSKVDRFNEKMEEIFIKTWNEEGKGGVILF